MSASDPKAIYESLVMDLLDGGGKRTKALATNTRAIMANVRQLREDVDRKKALFLWSSGVPTPSSPVTVAVAKTDDEVKKQPLSLDTLVQTTDHVRSLSEAALKTEQFVLSWRGMAIAVGALGLVGFLGYQVGKYRARKIYGAQP